jgi:hypothetical protein
MKKYALIVVSVVVLLLGLFFRNRRKNVNVTYIEEIKKQDKVLNTRTLSDKQVKSIVSNLYFDLLENATENEDDVLNQILQIKNVGDWLAVVGEFGVRSDNSYFKFFNGTLPQALSTYLDSDYLDEVRKHLQTINVQL